MYEPVPVARGAEFFQLFNDYAAVLVAPLFGDFYKFFAAEFPCGGFLFLAQIRLDFCLRCDARVVGAGYPYGVFPKLAGAAHENVLNCVV